jgi:hypothetical protein
VLSPELVEADGWWRWLYAVLDQAAEAIDVGTRCAYRVPGYRPSRAALSWAGVALEPAHCPRRDAADRDGSQGAVADGNRQEHG